MKLLLSATLCVAVLAELPAAQAPPAFEAASVKLNTSGGRYREIGPTPGGRFSATNTFTRDLIAFAYGVSQDSVSFRIVGGPKWIDEDRFNVVATVTGPWTFQQMRDMVRTLLADRFKLAAHADTREFPTYALLVLPNQPLRLRRSTVDEAACQARREAIQRREPIPPPVPGAPPICGSGRTNPGTITAAGGSMSSLASSLGQFVSRSVSDRTQLTGLFDFESTGLIIRRRTSSLVVPAVPGVPVFRRFVNGRPLALLRRYRSQANRQSSAGTITSTAVRRSSSRRSRSPRSVAV